MLTPTQAEHYSTRGYLVSDPVVDTDEIEHLLAALPSIAEARPEATLHDEDDGSLRIVYAVHDASRMFHRLVRLPALLEPAKQLLGGDTYVHQTKVTLNTPLRGAGWPWHQDYAFWGQRDRLPRPDVLSAAVLLDDMSTVNGPLMLVPESHRRMLTTTDGVLHSDQLTDVCSKNGIVPIVAPAGSVVYFHSRTVHASTANITPFHRRVLYITYNRSDNAPDTAGENSSEWTCAKDNSALAPLPGGETILASHPA